MHLHLWDPHTPYRTPADYQNPFEGDDLPTWITPDIFRRHQSLVAPHGCNEINMYTDEEHPDYPKHPGKIAHYGELRRVLDGYDCGVHYADQLLGQVFDLLRAQGIYEDTAIIFQRPRENQASWALRQHGTADEITCRIPMIIAPGLAPGRVTAAFHYSLDLLPTLADMLVCAGCALAGSPSKHLHNENRRPGCPGPRRWRMCQHRPSSDWLYIRTIHDGFRLFDEEMLFNITQDPHEQFDVKDDHRDCAQAPGSS